MVITATPLVRQGLVYNARCYNIITITKGSKNFLNTVSFFTRYDCFFFFGDEGQSQGQQNWARAGPDRPMDSLHTRGTCLEGMLIINSKSPSCVISNQDNMIGHCVAQLQVIFALPEHLHHSQLPNKLVYVEWFTPFHTPHPDSGLFPISCASQNNGPVTEIIPLNSIVSSCHFMPDSV